MRTSSGRKRRRPQASLDERFWSKVDKTGSCWLWLGAKDRKGYGQIWDLPKGRHRKSHRIAWEMVNGPIPAGRGKCRSCGAEVLWVEWPNTGKRMPVDESPDLRPPPKGGTIVLTLSGGPFGKLLAEKYDPSRHDARRNRYTSHFVTCPESKEWRKS